MITLVFCCRRNPNLSVEEFQSSWQNDHGPLVCSLRAAFPQMRRYVQSHTLPTQPVNRSGRGGARNRRTTASPRCGSTAWSSAH